MALTFDQAFDILRPHIMRGRITCIEGMPVLNPKTGPSFKVVEPGSKGGGLTLAQFCIEVPQAWAAPYTRGMPSLTHIVDEGNPVMAPAHAIAAGRDLLDRFIMNRRSRPVLALALTRYRAPFFSRYLKRDQLTEDAKIANLNDPIILSLWDADTKELLWAAERHDDFLGKAGIPAMGLGRTARPAAAPTAVRPVSTQEPTGTSPRRPATVSGQTAPAKVPVQSAVPPPPGNLRSKKPRKQVPAAIVAPDAGVAEHMPCPDGAALDLAPHEQAFMDDLIAYNVSRENATSIAEMHMVDPDRAMLIEDHIFGTVPSEAASAPGEEVSGIYGLDEPQSAAVAAERPKPKAKTKNHHAKVVPTSSAPRPRGASASSDDRAATAFLMAEDADISEWMVDCLKARGDGLAGRDLLDAVRLPRNAASAAKGTTLEKAYRKFLGCLERARKAECIMVQGGGAARRYFLPKE